MNSSIEIINRFNMFSIIENLISYNPFSKSIEKDLLNNPV